MTPVYLLGDNKTTVDTGTAREPSINAIDIHISRHFIAGLLMSLKNNPHLK